MKVKYVHQQPGFYGNILWSGRWPMRAGKFPPGHPVGGGFEDGNQMGLTPGMERFRLLGYWASCFPEGDGITMKCERGQEPAQVTQDIQDCFGWEVT